MCVAHQIRFGRLDAQLLKLQTTMTAECKCSDHSEETALAIIQGPAYNCDAALVGRLTPRPVFRFPPRSPSTMKRPIHTSLALVALAGLVLAATVRGADTVPLKKDDKVLFLGDSITQAAVGKDGYITIIKKELDEKHKDLGVQTIGAGISGNKVPDLQRRLEKDVLAKQPNIVFIYIGINDVWHGENDPTRGTPKDMFEAGLKDVIGRITKAGGKVVLCTPTVIGEKKDGANKLDARLDEYAAVSRLIAKEMNLPLCDLRKAFVDYLKANNPDNKESGILTSDRVHLNAAGNKLVAETMLKMLAP
jgi:lysophospholipase L1-like esterase